MLICIFRHMIYGTSGNELPPPVIAGKSYVVHQVGTDEEFRAATQELGMKLRTAARAKMVKPYSQHDSWDWSWLEVTDPAEFAAFVQQYTAPGT